MTFKLKLVNLLVVNFFTEFLKILQILRFFPSCLVASHPATGGWLASPGWWLVASHHSPATRVSTARWLATMHLDDQWLAAGV